MRATVNVVSDRQTTTNLRRSISAKSKYIQQLLLHPIIKSTAVKLFLPLSTQLSPKRTIIKCHQSPNKKIFQSSSKHKLSSLKRQGSKTKKQCLLHQAAFCLHDFRATVNVVSDRQTTTNLHRSISAKSQSKHQLLLHHMIIITSTAMKRFLQSSTRRS